MNKLHLEQQKFQLDFGVKKNIPLFIEGYFLDKKQIYDNIERKVNNMKLDYEFIKQILLTLEGNEEHLMELENIFKILNIKDDKDIDKLAGHLKIIGDNFCIECSSANYGFSYSVGNFVSINGNAKYRLTARGYEFLDILKKDTIFNKIKDLSISTAFEVGKNLLTTYLSGKV